MAGGSSAEEHGGERWATVMTETPPRAATSRNEDGSSTGLMATIRPSASLLIPAKA